MEAFYSNVVKHRKKIMLLFFAAAIICVFCKPLVRVNYDMNDYLPENAPSSAALDVMGEEFDGAIPNARVMVKDVGIAQALDYKDQIKQVDGVTAVNWLDDTFPITIPLEMMPKDTVETYYKDNNALFSVTIADESINSAIPAIRKIVGDDNCITGVAASTATATASTVVEIKKITIFAVLIVLLILIVTTQAWAEPFVVLLGLGIAIILNSGSNLIFGEISFVTNAAGSILQLAVSLDYSVFLLHRFTECKAQQPDAEKAMVQALTMSTSSILSSGLTTVIGFIALCLMRFRIGPDLGLALAKGIGISLLTVFLFMPGLIMATINFIEKTYHRPFVPSFRKFGGLIQKITIPCVCVFILLIVPSYVLSNNNSFYYGSSHIFSAGTQYGDDTAEIEKVFGTSDTYVVMVPRGNEATERKLSNALSKLDGVKSITSLVDFAGASVPTEMFPSELSDQLESDNYRRMLLSVDVDYEGDETFALIEQIRGTAQQYYPDTYYLAGAGVSTYDLMDTVTKDMTKVNLLAIASVFVVLIFTMRSFMLPVILVLTIETAIGVNLSIPWLVNKTIFYIAYLILSSVQLGATVDYAILFTERYKENRQTLDKKAAVRETVSNVTASIFTSATCLIVVGFLLGIISTHGLLSQLGYMLGRGTICSLCCVLFVLPGLLYLSDRTFRISFPIPGILRKKNKQNY